MAAWKGGSGGWEGRMAGRGRGVPGGAKPAGLQHVIRPEETPEAKLRREIVLLCDAALAGPADALISACSDEVGKLGRTLREAGGNDTLREAAVGALVDCAQTLPTKAPLYAAAVAQSCSPSLAASLAARVSDALQRAVDGLRTTPAKLLLRLAAELCRARAADAGSFVRLLDALTSSASGAAGDAADWAFHVAALGVAWGGGVLRERAPEALGGLVERLSAAPQAVGRDWLGAEWAVVQHASANDAWDLHLALPGLARGPEDSKEFAVAQLPAFSALSTAALEAAGARMPQSVVPPEPLGLFSDEHREMVSLPALERLLLEDVFCDVLEGFSESSADAARFLLAVPLAPSRPPARALLVETLLSHLLSTPPLQGRQRPAFYGAVLAHLGKQERSVTIAFVEAVRVLFSRVEEMDTEQVERFAEWLAWHLSNYEFLWSWEQWNKAAESNGKDSETARFLETLLGHCTRLSYPERIRKAVGENLSRLVSDPVPFTFAAAESAVGKELLAKLEGKQPPSAIKEWLEEAVSSGKLLPEERLEIFAKCFFVVCSKSFTHLSVAIQKYALLLRELFSGPEEHALILQFLGEFWLGSVDQMATLCDRLLIARIVDASSIVEWIFTSPALLHQPEPQHYHGTVNAFVWEIVRNVLSKLFTRLEFATKELQSPKHDDEARKRIHTAIEAAQSEAVNVSLSVLHHCVEAHEAADNNHQRRVVTGHATEVLRTYWSHLEASIDLQLQSALATMDERFGAMFSDATAPVLAPSF